MGHEWRSLVVACFVISSLGSACQTTPAPVARTRDAGTAFDVVIAGGRIVDGTGAPWFRGDIGIVGDRIAAIGELGGRAATTRIDAANLSSRPASSTCWASRSSTCWLTAAPPGRSRRASPPRSPARGLRSRRSTIALIRRSRSSTVQGRAGLPHPRRVLHPPGARSAGDQRRHVRRRRRAARLRDREVAARRHSRRTGTDEDARRQAMEQGALGVSTSLQYVPDRFASTDEIVELAKVAAADGGVISLISDRNRTRSSPRSTRCSRLPSGRTFPPKCGTSRPHTRPTGDGCRKC